MKSRVFCTLWRNISGEAAGAICHPRIPCVYGHPIDVFGDLSTSTMIFPRLKKLANCGVNLAWAVRFLYPKLDAATATKNKR